MRSLLISQLLLVALCLISVQANAYSRIIVFGDSALDGGNDATAVNSYYKRYGSPFTDLNNVDQAQFSRGFRYSNGYTFIEVVAQSLSLFDPDTFVNYSAGGQTAAALDGLIQNYLDEHTVDPEGLYVVQLGMNDLSESTKLITNNIMNGLNKLHDNGVKNILVVNSFLGVDLPTLKNENRKEQIIGNNATVLFNEILKKQIATLAFKDDVIYFDLGKMIHQINLDPYLYDFNNASDACLTIENQTVQQCEDIDRYFFWDEVHLTRSAHQTIAALLLSYLQSPDNIGVLLKTSAQAAQTTVNQPTIFSALTTLATDNNIANVSFYVDKTLIAIDEEAPYSIEFASEAPGTHTIEAVAEDTQGNTTSSQSLTITAIPQTEPVSVYLSDTSRGATQGKLLIYLIENILNVDKVELWANDELLLNTFNAPPYQFEWFNAPDGEYEVSAKVYSDKVIITSPTLSVVVNNSLDKNPPAVDIDLAASNNGYVSGSLTANVSNGDDAVTTVTFLAGGDTVAEDNSAPYTLNWDGIPAGSYIVNAIATDRSGLSTVSDPILIEVKPTN